MIDGRTLWSGNVNDIDGTPVDVVVAYRAPQPDVIEGVDVKARHGKRVGGYLRSRALQMAIVEMAGGV